MLDVKESARRYGLLALAQALNDISTIIYQFFRATDGNPPKSSIFAAIASELSYFHFLSPMIAIDSIVSKLISGSNSDNRSDSLSSPNC
jgi:hypothetical protein